MKITKNQLSQIIKEELQRVILEQPDGEVEEEETEEVIKWDEHDQDNQDAQHTPWASSKEEAIEWIEEHTEVTGVGTQDTIDLVTLLISRIGDSGGVREEELWQEVASFFEEKDSDDPLILKTPTRQDISTLKKKLRSGLPREDWDTVGNKPRIWK